MLKQEGLRISMQQGATVSDYVELYLTDQIIENIQLVFVMSVDFKQTKAIH